MHVRVARASFVFLVCVHVCMLVSICSVSNGIGTEPGRIFVVVMSCVGCSMSITHNGVQMCVRIAHKQWPR